MSAKVTLDLKTEMESGHEGLVSKASSLYTLNTMGLAAANAINASWRNFQEPNQDQEEEELTTECDEIITEISTQQKNTLQRTKHESQAKMTYKDKEHLVQKSDRVGCPCPECPLHGEEQEEESEIIEVKSFRSPILILDDKSLKKESEVEYEESLDEERVIRLIRYEKEEFKINISQEEGGEETLHYIEYPISPQSYEEGAYVFDDYMKIFISPTAVCHKPLSSLTSSSYLSCEDYSLQRTIVIVKFEAIKYRQVILRAIFESECQIVGSRVLHLKPEQVADIYCKYYGSPSFAHLVLSVSAAPVLVLSISARNVVRHWNVLIGPDGSLRKEWFYPLSMRKMFGLVETQPGIIVASETVKDAFRENRYLFPENILDPLICEEEKVWDYCGLRINKVISEGCTEVIRRKPLDPVRFLAEWLLTYNPFQPRMLKKIALTPT